MFRLTLLSAAAALYACALLVGCVSDLRVAHRTPESPRQSATGQYYFVVPPAPRQENGDADPLDDRFIVIEAERFTLIYPAWFTRLLPLEVVLQHIDDSFQRVEALLGEFDERVEIFVPGSITADDLPEGLMILGLCWVDDGQIKVAVSLPAARVIDTFAHELLHARLRDLDIRPPRWFEEGMAHMLEFEDGFNADLFRLLEQVGMMSNEELEAAARGITSDEMRLRATGWAIAYYYVHIEGIPLEDVATWSEFPEMDVVWAAVLKAAADREVLARLAA